VYGTPSGPPLHREDDNALEAGRTNSRAVDFHACGQLTTSAKERRAGWPRVIAHPGLPQIRTCRTTASGSSNDNFASHTITRCESGLLSAGVASTQDRSSVPPPRVLPAGLSLAGVASTQDRSSVPPPRVLPAGLSLDASLPSSGSSRPSSPTSTVLSRRYDACRPSRRTSLPSLGGTTGTLAVLLPRRPSVAADGPGVGHPVSPAGNSSMETTGSPKFLVILTPLSQSATVLHLAFHQRWRVGRLTFSLRFGNRQSGRYGPTGGSLAE